MIKIIIAAIIAFAISVFIWQICKPTTFIGRLHLKTTEIAFSSDSETITVNSDGEIETIGEDSTTAYKSYILQFYVDGELKNITVARFVGRASETDRNDLALQDLAQTDIEPAEWTYAKENTEYLVKQSLGSVEITPMIVIKPE